MKNKNIEDIFKQITYIATLLYLLDIILLGSGNLIKIGGISTRMLFFAVAILFCIPGMLKNLKKYITNKYCISVGIFMFLVAAALVCGVYHGNSRMIISTDIKGFLNILILYPMIYTLDTQEKIETVLKIMTGTLLGVACVALVLSFYMKFPVTIQRAAYSFFRGTKLCGISSLNANVTRIFFHTAGRWFFIGFMFLLTFIVLKEEKKWVKEIGLAVFINACLISYTRSIYLGIFVCFMVFIIVVFGILKPKAKAYFSSLLRMSVMTVVLALVLSLLQGDNLILVAINRCLIATVNTEEFVDEEDFNDNEENVDNDNIIESNSEVAEIEKSIEQKFDNAKEEISNLEIRDLRKKLAVENIKEHPVFGNGLGVVNDINGEHIEYFYLDLMSKMGMVGLAALFIPFVLCMYDFVRYHKQMSEKNKLYLFAAMIGTLFLFVISYFNPCMNTNVGLAIYCLCMTVANVSRNEYEEEKN